MTLSFRAYNEKIGLGLFCPIASKVKGYPFEVEIVSGVIQGAVLSDQIKSLDWVERNIEFIEKIDSAKLQEVIEKIEVIIK